MKDILLERLLKKLHKNDLNLYFKKQNKPKITKNKDQYGLCFF